MSNEEFGMMWCEAWSSPDSRAFSLLYAPGGRYTDIPFGITRVGHALVQKHHAHWHSAIPDFIMQCDQVMGADKLVVVQTLCTGVFSGADLAGGRMKATGKPFRCRAITVLNLDSDRLIQTCTEYYDRGVMPGGAATLFDDLEEKSVAA